MDNKKIPTWLGAVIIIIFAMTVGAFVWRYENDRPVAKLPPSTISTKITQPTQSPTKNPLESANDFSISDNWTVVSHDNFWNNPSIFPNGKRKFPSIKFSYPSNWKFDCCGDMDHASVNYIRPSENRDALPLISITYYALSGCQNANKICAIDEQIRISASEKFNRLTSIVPKENILPKVRLKNLNTNTFVYNKTESDNRSSRGYIINLGNDVIEIDFINNALLNDIFIEKFLQNILFEAK